MNNRLAALTLTALLLGGAPYSAAGTEAESGTRTWHFDLTSAARRAVELDIAQIVPLARPVVERLAGLVVFDADVSLCAPPAESCSLAGTGPDGRWGVHLD